MSGRIEDQVKAEIASRRLHPDDGYSYEECNGPSCRAIRDAAARAAAPTVEPDHALHFDPSCEECAYLARPVAIHVPSPDRVAGQPDCGAPSQGGPCVLPRGHNIGRADIPENHIGHSVRAAAPPVEAGETRAQYGPDYTASRGPQIRRDGYHYGHCWRRWVEIEPDEVAPCICAEWPPDPVDEQREGERAYERGAASAAVVASSEHGTLVCIPRRFVEAWAQQFSAIADMVEFGGDIPTEATVGENSVRAALLAEPVPGLDVERLARVLHADLCDGSKGHHHDDCEGLAKRYAAEYARLTDPKGATDGE